MLLDEMKKFLGIRRNSSIAKADDSTKFQDTLFDLWESSKDPRKSIWMMSVKTYRKLYGLVDLNGNPLIDKRVPRYLFGRPILLVNCNVIIFDNFEGR